MAVGSGVFEETRVVFRACTSAQLRSSLAAVTGPGGTVVLVRRDVPDAVILADAELLLGERTLTRLRVWLATERGAVTPFPR